MSVKISPKYQVVIPEKVRKALGLCPGTLVDVIAKGGVAYLVPLTPLSDIQSRLKGKLSSKGIREKRDRKL